MVLNELRQNISNTINDSHLSIDAIYFVLKDIYKEVEQLYYLECQKEINNIEIDKESES